MNLPLLLPQSVLGVTVPPAMNHLPTLRVRQLSSTVCYKFNQSPTNQQAPPTSNPNWQGPGTMDQGMRVRQSNLLLLLVTLAIYFAQKDATTYKRARDGQKAGYAC